MKMAKKKPAKPAKKAPAKKKATKSKKKKAPSIKKRPMKVKTPSGAPLDPVSFEPIITMGNKTSADADISPIDILMQLQNRKEASDQVKNIVMTCGDELKAINDTYQSMKERQMDIMEQMEAHIFDNAKGLTESQTQSIKQSVRDELIKCMNIYSEDQITDQKFLLAIITLNELFSGHTQAQDNLYLP